MTPVDYGLGTQHLSVRQGLGLTLLPSGSVTWDKLFNLSESQRGQGSHHPSQQVVGRIGDVFEGYEEAG